ncbi:DM13 domain-containing protein [Flavobacterium sp. FlaQc-52]|jgi:hypothetical protein|uniref:DM13 domain-containing protein n=1 Tax=Flavobacterium sp. FlaQc-52 TaxID=3374185 RepID=UPI003757DBC0
MKNTIYLLFLISVLSSCESEGELTRKPVGSVEIPVTAVVTSSGNFAPTSGHSVSGSAKIYSDGTHRNLALENFTVTNGPDLKVYLSKSSSPVNFVNLGSLGNGTNQAFRIPDNVDLSVYPYVLIHCQQFNHLFAFAKL